MVNHKSDNNNELCFDLDEVEMIGPFWVPRVEDEYVVVRTMRHLKDKGKFKVTKQYLKNCMMNLSSGKKKIRYDELEIQCQICGYKKNIKFIPSQHFKMLDETISGYFREKGSEKKH